MTRIDVHSSIRMVCAMRNCKDTDLMHKKVISRLTLDKIRKGGFDIRISTVERIADHYKLDPVEFLQLGKEKWIKVVEK